MSDLLKPQPPPKIGVDSIEVWPSFIEAHGHELPLNLVTLMRLRNEQGICKYGAPLTTNNGRDALTDAFQEALDLCVYLHQADLERGRASEHLRRAIAVTLALFWRLDGKP